MKSRNTFDTFSLVCPAMPLTTPRGKPTHSSTGPCSMWIYNMKQAAGGMQSELYFIVVSTECLNTGNKHNQRRALHLNITPNWLWVISELLQVILCNFYGVFLKSILNCHTTEQKNILINLLIMDSLQINKNRDLFEKPFISYLQCRCW